MLGLKQLPQNGMQSSWSYGNDLVTFLKREPQSAHRSPRRVSIRLARSRAASLAVDRPPAPSVWPYSSRSYHHHSPPVSLQCHKFQRSPNALIVDIGGGGDGKRGQRTYRSSNRTGSGRENFSMPHPITELA